MPGGDVSTNLPTGGLPNGQDREHGRTGRRHPPRRRHDASARADGARHRCDHRILRRAELSESRPAVPRLRRSGRAVRTDARRPRLEREGSAGRGPRRGRRREDRRDRKLRAAPRPAHCRGGICGRRRLAAPGNRHAPRRAARGPCCRARHRPVRRRGDAGERGDARRVRACGLPHQPRARGRGGRGRVPDHADRGVHRTRRRARPRRRHRLAAARSSCRRRSP